MQEVGERSTDLYRAQVLNWFAFAAAARRDITLLKWNEEQFLPFFHIAYLDYKNLCLSNLHLSFSPSGRPVVRLGESARPSPCFLDWVNAPIYCAPICYLGTWDSAFTFIYNFRFWGRKIFHLDFWRQWLSIVPFFNIRNGDLGPTLFLIRYFCYSRGQLPRVEFTCPKGKLSSLYFKTDFEFERGGRDDKGIGQRHLSSHRRSGPNLISNKGLPCQKESNVNGVPRKSPLYCSI